MELAQRIGGIIQARMRSQRLPGKVLMPLDGTPMLQYVVERVSHAQRISQVVVTTSEEPDDDPIAAFCDEHGVACFRGQHDNVARRYLATLEHYGFDAFARICGDSPLIDPALIDHGLEILATGRYEGVTNNLERTFPSGQTIEIFGTPPYRRGYYRMETPEHFEHVTRYFYENPGDFRIHNFKAHEDCSQLGTTIDTPQDFERVDAVIRRMDKPHWQYTWRQIVGDMYTAQL
jgi:spore coat polysaccharide biosynthesis protein SpsF